MTLTLTRSVSHAERQTSVFYRSVGWRTENGVTEDARRFEDLRPVASRYLTRCRRRVARHVGCGERLLDMGSGPIQYPEYLEYSADYARRVCVDLSPEALDGAREKIGEHGEFLCGSLFDLGLETDAYDGTVSLHAIYHIAAAQQEAAVRTLLRVTKPGRPVIIVYSNPRALGMYLEAIYRRLVPRRAATDAAPALYFYPHRLEWWDQFRDTADVEILPWRSFSTETQRACFPANAIGRAMFAALYQLEEWAPRLFARIALYPMIVLRKRAA